jgi:chromosome segregation ATPase
LTIDAEKLSTLVDMRYYRAKRQQHEQDTLPDALQQLWDSLQQDLPQAPSPHAMVRTVSPHAIKILEDHDRLAGFKAHITSKRLSHTNTALDNGLRKITDLYQSNKTVIEQLHSIRLEQQAKIAQLTSKMNQLEAQRLQQQSRIEQLTAKMSELAAAGERLQKTARQELKKTRAIADQAIVILASIDRQLADPVNRPYRMALSIADRLTRLAGRKPTDLINQRIGKLQGDIRELRARQWQLQAGEHGEVD